MRQLMIYIMWVVIDLPFSIYVQVAYVYFLSLFIRRRKGGGGELPFKWIGWKISLKDYWLVKNWHLKWGCVFIEGVDFWCRCWSWIILENTDHCIFLDGERKTLKQSSWCGTCQYALLTFGGSLVERFWEKYRSTCKSDN